MTLKNYFRIKVSYFRVSGVTDPSFLWVVYQTHQCLPFRDFIPVHENINPFTSLVGPGRILTVDFRLSHSDTCTQGRSHPLGNVFLGVQNLMVKTFDSRTIKKKLKDRTTSFTIKQIINPSPTNPMIIGFSFVVYESVILLPYFDLCVNESSSTQIVLINLS